MTLNAKDYPPGTAIYSFVAEDGVNTHVDSEKLRLWCVANRAKLEVVETPISRIMAKSFLLEAVVDPAHVKTVLNMTKLDPIIYGVTNFGTDGLPDVLLIDGHHRYVAAAVLGAVTIPAYLLMPEQWRPFQIMGLPNLRKEELMAMPTKPRSL